MPTGLFLIVAVKRQLPFLLVFFIFLGLVFSPVSPLSNINTAKASGSFHAKTGSFSLGSTNNTTLTITGLGFQPKYVIFYGHLATSDYVANDSHNSFYGVAKSATERFAVSNRILHGSADSDSSMMHYEAAMVMKGSSNSTPIAVLDNFTPTADGFTVDLTSLSSAVYNAIVMYQAFGGDDITNVKVGYITAKTSTTGTQSYTGIGFQGDYLQLFAGMASSSALPFGSSGHARRFISHTIADGTSYVSAVGEFDGQATTNNARYQGATGAVKLSGPAGDLAAANFYSWDSDGFTLNYTTVASSAYKIGYLVVEGPQFDLRPLNQPTSMGNQTVSGLSFQPEALWIQSVSAPSSTTIDPHNTFAVGSATSATDTGTSFMASQDNVATSVVVEGQFRDKAIMLADPNSTATYHASAALDSFNSDGYVLNWDTVDATSREILVLAIGPAAGITISGNVYSDEGTTPYDCSANNLTVAVKVNGAGSVTGTCTLNTGEFSLLGVPVAAAGDVVTIYLDGEATQAATITRAADTSTNLSSIPLYENRVILRQEDAGPITNTNLDLFDSGSDADIPFTVTGGALTITGSTELFVASGETFTPGGNVTTPKLDIRGTYNAGSTTLTITGTGTGSSRPFNNAGTFTASTGTVVYSGDGAVDPEGGTFYNLTFSPTITSGRTYTTNGALTVNNNFSINPSAASAFNLSVVQGGDTTVSGTLTITKTSSATSSLSTSSSSYALNAGAVNIASGGSLTLNSSTLTLTGSGTPLTVAGTFTPGSSTTVYNSTSATNVAATTYNALSLTPSGAATYTLGTASSQTVRVDSTFTIGNGSDSLSVTAATYNPALDLRGTVTINSGATYTKGSGLTTFKFGGIQILNDNTASKQDLGAVKVSANVTNNTLELATSAKVTSITVDASQALDLNGSNTLTLTGSGSGSSRPFIINGTFTRSAGTIVYAGTSATEVTAANYYGLTLAPAGAVTYTLGTVAGQTLQTTGALTIGDGTNAVTVDANTYDTALDVEGDLTINANAVFTKGDGGVFFNKGAAQTWTDNTASKQDIGSVRISVNSTNTTVNLGSSVKLTYLTVNANQTINFNSGTLIMTASGSGMLSNSGTIDEGTGGFEFAPDDTAGVTLPSRAYNNLTVNKALTTFTMPAGTHVISDTLTVAAGTLNLNTNDPTVYASNLVINDTLSASNLNSLTIYSRLTNNGTFTANNGVVYLSPSEELTINGSNGITFYSLNISNMPTRSVKFKDGNTYTIEGTFNASGANKRYLRLESVTPGSQWTILLNGTPVVSHLYIVDSACHASSSNISVGETSINGGNNGACWVFVNRSAGSTADGSGAGGSGASSGGGAGGGTSTGSGSGGTGSTGGGTSGGGGSASP